MEVSCLLCRKVMSHQGLHVHINRTHLGIKTYSQGNNGKYAQISAAAAIKKQLKLSEYDKSPKLCVECNIKIDYDKRCNSFCSSNCSAVHNHKKRKSSGWKPSEEQRKKVSAALSCDRVPRVVALCKLCNSEFRYIFRNKEREYCTEKCLIASRRLNRKPLLNYRADCAFKFNLKDYPGEFDFALIENFGWYSAKNRGNNLTGISRDHMVSVKYGFDNGVDPAIIAHPANCKLMQHSHNSSKCDTCSITLDELLHRIKEWDSKY